MFIYFFSLFSNYQILNKILYINIKFQASSIKSYKIPPIKFFLVDVFRSIRRDDNDVGQVQGKTT